jgi:hypothetical protein
MTTAQPGNTFVSGYGSCGGSGGGSGDNNGNSNSSSYDIWVEISKDYDEEARNSKSEEEEQQPATQQQTNIKAQDRKSSKGEANGAQKHRGGAAAHNATTNHQLSRDHQRLKEGCKQQQKQRGGAAERYATTNLCEFKPRVM